MHLAFLVSASLASFAAAYTTPTSGPAGNPITSPSLQEHVPVGASYTIKWTPTNTTADTVTLLLISGPDPTKLQPLGPLVEKLPNTGSYDWTPKTDLVGGDTTYGIQLIDDATGIYQYSTPFKVDNSSPIKSSGGGNGTMTTTKMSSTATVTATLASYTSSGNSTILPTGAMTVPSSLRSAAATSTSGSNPTSAGAASSSTSSGAAAPAATMAFSGGSLFAAIVALGYAL